MQCCGLPTSFLYERLKAAEAEGSEVAKVLLDDCWFSQGAEPREAEEDRERKISTREAEKSCCQRGNTD